MVLPELRLNTRGSQQHHGIDLTVGQFFSLIELELLVLFLSSEEIKNKKQDLIFFRMISL